jgi:hypothetical protein
MNNTKFTKGEWFIDEGDSMDCSHLITTNYRSVENNIVPIVEIETEFDGVIGVEQKANSHLIAAAPEMYELLLFLLRHDSISDASLDADVVALLAKARGEKQ